MLLSSLDGQIARTVTSGDGLFNHYGKRSPFTMVERRGNTLLFLELGDSPKLAFARTAVNATGGYGTGILGGENSFLNETVLSALASAVDANDEHHSSDRLEVVDSLTALVATHTGTVASDWSITFTSTGTEAMDFALQALSLEGYDLTTGGATRAARDVIVAFHGAWHGWGSGPSHFLDRRQFTDGTPRFNSLTVQFAPYGDISALERIFRDFSGRVRFVVAEGILGDGGVVPAPTEWWSRLFELADRESARVLVDEILTGFRTGSILAMPRGRAPDCLTLGKGLGLGLFPLSAVLWRSPAISPRPGIGVRTFNLRPFEARIVGHALKHIEREKFFERSVALGRTLLAQLQSIVEIAPRKFKAVRGAGLFLGVELADQFARQGHAIRDALLRCGVLTEVESGTWSRKVPREFRHNETIRLTPPLTITLAEVDAIVEAFRTCAVHADSAAVLAGASASPSTQ